MKFHELFKKFNLVPLNQFKKDPLARGIVEHGEQQLATVDNKEAETSILIHISRQIQKIYN